MCKRVVDDEELQQLLRKIEREDFHRLNIRDEDDDIDSVEAVAMLAGTILVIAVLALAIYTYHLISRGHLHV